MSSISSEIRKGRTAKARARKRALSQKAQSTRSTINSLSSSPEQDAHAAPPDVPSKAVFVLKTRYAREAH